LTNSGITGTHEVLLQLASSCRPLRPHENEFDLFFQCALQIFKICSSEEATGASFAELTAASPQWIVLFGVELERHFVADTQFTTLGTLACCRQHSEKLKPLDDVSFCVIKLSEQFDICHSFAFIERIFRVIWREWFECRFTTDATAFTSKNFRLLRCSGFRFLLCPFGGI
jgi:hypothetical protein